MQKLILCDVKLKSVSHNIFFSQIKQLRKSLHFLPATNFDESLFSLVYWNRLNLIVLNIRIKIILQKLFLGKICIIYQWSLTRFIECNNSSYSDERFLFLALRSLYDFNACSFSGQLYGLEKFWAFLKYYKHSGKLQVDPKLKEYLSKFKSIEDFRVVQVMLWSLGEWCSLCFFVSLFILFQIHSQGIEKTCDFTIN